jgi:hypothetical protein
LTADYQHLPLVIPANQAEDLRRIVLEGMAAVVAESH